MRVLPRRPWQWAVAALAVVALLAVGGPFVYIHFIEGAAPAPLSLKPSASADPGRHVQQAASTPVTGTWRVGRGTQVGYRVKEVLMGQNNIAVGRTRSVSGSVTITGTSVTAGRFSVRMATIHSDQSQRDAQFDGRIMDVTAYPTGTFILTSPIRLAPLPAAGAVKTYRATGNLTLHGRTRAVTFPLSAERTAAGIEVSGAIPITFADFGIANPGFGSFVTTQNHGILEFLLKLMRA